MKSFVQERAQFDKFSHVSDELLDQNLFIGYAFSVVEPIMMFVGYGAVYLAIWTLSGMVATDAGVVSSIASFIGYLTVKAVRHTTDKLTGLGNSCRPFHLGQGSIEFPLTKIVGNGPAKENSPLQDN